MFMFKYNCTSKVDLFTANCVEEIVLQYITTFILSNYYYYINCPCSHKQPTLCDISATSTVQSPPQHYLFPGFFTVNKPPDESQHSEVAFYLFISHFHFSDLRAKVIIV